ncbi:hypothetical protein L0F63_005897 [Massospora cicadina]|nr:hypothetical protein L0F63_005897 [Massospora cicadina]
MSKITFNHEPTRLVAIKLGYGLKKIQKIPAVDFIQRLDKPGVKENKTRIISLMIKVPDRLIKSRGTNGMFKKAFG